MRKALVALATFCLTLLVYAGILSLELRSVRGQLNNCSGELLTEQSNVAALTAGIDQQNRRVREAEAVSDLMRKARAAAMEQLAHDARDHAGEVDRLRREQGSGGNCDAVRVRLVREAAR